MTMLNPHQFKIDLGEQANSSHDILTRNNHFKAAGELNRPATSAPPAGYYDQPSGRVLQQALPGMEMSEQDHLDALSDHVGGLARVRNGENYHSLQVAHPGGLVSDLLWGDARKTHPVRDVGQQSGMGRPGEIRRVSSYQKGTASAMLSTAEALAREHGYTFPKHSEMRTSAGVGWSQNQMAKRGERVW